MVYDQSFGTSREALLESFKTAQKAVLMGTRSFWEGVDIPGDDLSAVVIADCPLRCQLIRFFSSFGIVHQCLPAICCPRCYTAIPARIRPLDPQQ